MRPTTANDDNVFDFNSLLHPGTVFGHPKDVVADPRLTVSRSARSSRHGHPTRRRSRHARRSGLPTA